jgi:hypothetical protein
MTAIAWYLCYANALIGIYYVYASPSVIVHGIVTT